MGFKIGKLNIKNNIILAPMAGISNPTYLKIVEQMGCGLAITELISAEAISRNNQKTLDMLKGLEEINMPVGVQLFGSNPKTLAKAAKIVVDLYHVPLIDINMGCPVPKVAIKSHAGSALLKEPAKIYDIVSSVVAAVDVPVTVKIRAGWDDKHINCVEVAQICEKAGASAITLHARTRAQGYGGKANWTLIKDVVSSVKIPVIGNGDVLSCYDAKRMLDETNCAAVMIGRGVIGNPWLIKECVDYLNDGVLPTTVTLQEKIDMMKAHLHTLVIAKGENRAVLEIRTHFLQYLKGVPNVNELKNNLCKAKTEKEINELLDNFFK